MRRFAIPTLLLVFALISGACAVRQVRTRSIPVPPTAEIAAPVAVESVPAPTPAIELAPIREQDDAQAAEPALTVQQQINRYAAREIAANDAANRAASEKTNRADAPAPPAVTTRSWPPSRSTPPASGSSIVASPRSSPPCGGSSIR